MSFQKKSAGYSTELHVKMAHTVPSALVCCSLDAAIESLIKS